MRLAFAVMTLALAGCETPYGEPNLLMGMSFGVTSTQLDPTTVRVTAGGNAFTSAETIERYVMRKAAEDTLTHGFDWFGILQSQDRTRFAASALPGSSSTTFDQFGAETTYRPGAIITNDLPGQSILVRMGSGPKPDGAFDAREVLSFVVDE